MFTNALKRPGKTSYPYFAFISGNGQNLAVAVVARNLEDARHTVRTLLKPGQFTTSVVRLHKNDERTAKWLEHYSTPKPYPSQGV